MEKLDILHHKIIVTIFILVIFITGITFGVKISGATMGTDGMQIIIFALNFLIVVLLFILFTQVIHLKDDVHKLHKDHMEKLQDIAKKKR